MTLSKRSALVVDFILATNEVTKHSKIKCMTKMSSMLRDKNILRLKIFVSKILM